MADNTQDLHAGQAPAWFYEYAPVVQKHGFRPVPADGKRMVMANWTSVVLDPLILETYPNHNVGLLTKWNPALDVDVPDVAAAKVLRERLPEKFPWMAGAPCRVGSAPKFLLLFRTDAPFPKRKVRLQKGDLKVGVEWLADGQQFIAYGIHPDTQRPYMWIDGARSPARVLSDSLVTVTAEMADAVLREAEAILRSLGYSAVVVDIKEAKGAALHAEGATAMPNVDGAPQWMIECLRRLDPHDRETWIRAGHICKAASDQGLEAGYEAWVTWSQLAENYQDGDEDRWSTFKPRNISNPEHALKVMAGITEDPKAGFEAEPPEPPTDLFKFDNIQTRKLNDFPFVIPGLVPRDVPTLLSAHGGTGKSYVSLQMAVCVAAGIPFLGRETQAGRVMYYTCEEPEHELALRLQRILAALMLTPADLGGRLQIFNGYGKGDNIMFTSAKNVEDRLTAKYWTFLNYAKWFKPDLVLLDNISEVFDANEIERAMVRQFVQSMNAICKWTHCGLILIGHVDAATSVGKHGKGYSGSTAWHNSVRSRLFMKPGEAKGVVLLEPSKSNYGPPEDTIQLTFNNDTKVFEMTGTITKKEAPPVEDAAALIVMRALAGLSDRGIEVNTATGPNGSGMAILAKEVSLERRVVGVVLTELLRRGWLEKQARKTKSRKTYTTWAITDLGRAGMVNEVEEDDPWA